MKTGSRQVEEFDFITINILRYDGKIVVKLMASCGYFADRCMWEMM